MPKQEQRASQMCRLAVRNEPPGGFWKNPETSIQQCRKMTQRSCYGSRHCTVIQSRLKEQENNSPNLEFASITNQCECASNQSLLALAHTPTSVPLLTFPLFSILKPPKLLSKVPPRTTAPLLSPIPSLSAYG